MWRESEKKVVLLRNPWGFQEWIGAYELNHNLSLTLETGYGINLTNGEFFMSWSDFLKVSEEQSLISKLCPNFVTFLSDLQKR